MPQRSRLLLFVVIALACAPGALAWGPQGHRTVGAVADQLLSPAARTLVSELLQGDLDKFGNRSGRTSLEEVSVWADELHGTAAAEPAWHYDDLPICGGRSEARYCPDGQCNSEQITRLTRVLADTRASLHERNEALKWVVHLVGDIHQPLHAADNADHGGNRVRVALTGLRTRGRETLHRAWDTELVPPALHARGRQQPPPDIAGLTQEATRLARDAGQGTPETWARESNNLARNVAYNYAGFACNSVPPAIVILDARYQQEAVPIVRERLLLAGARLAALLNQTLAPAPPGRRPQ